MQYQRGSFIILVGLTAFLLLLVIVSLRFIYTWSKRVKHTKRLFIELLQNFNHPIYTNIKWQDKMQDKHFLTSIAAKTSNTTAVHAYDCHLARLAIDSIMSTYNINKEPSSTNGKLVKIIGPGACHWLCDDVNIVAFRGTATRGDALLDLNFSQCLFEANYTPLTTPALVHEGFYQWWKTHRDATRDVLISLEADNIQSTLVITGHSMGAAVACMAAIDLACRAKTTNIVLYLVGAPQVGNDGFYRILHDTVGGIYSIENTRDIVTQLPPPVAPTWSTSYIYDHVDERSIIRLNFETGALSANHHLDSYAIALDASATPHNWRWNRGRTNAFAL